MSLADRLEVARRQLGDYGQDEVLLAAFEEPPAEARSWAEAHGIEVVVSPQMRPGTIYLVNPSALGDLVRH